eukprot:scpid110146/ scgid15571/ 
MTIIICWDLSVEVDSEAESPPSSPVPKRHKLWASTLGDDLPYGVTCRSALMSGLTQSRKRSLRSNVSPPDSKEYARATPPRASWCFPGRTCFLFVSDCEKTVIFYFKVH